MGTKRNDMLIEMASLDNPSQCSLLINEGPLYTCRPMGQEYAKWITVNYYYSRDGNQSWSWTWNFCINQFCDLLLLKES